MRYLATLFLFSLCLSVNATEQTCEDSTQCTEQGQWHLGLAIGAGIRSNPLVDGDHIPLVVLPDIAWYGKAAYFDNGELGYQWHDSSNSAFETFVSIDSERGYFSFWHPANVLVFNSQSSIEFPLAPNNDLTSPEREVSINDVASRKWALNGGVRYHLRGQTDEWQFTFLTDVSSVHNGQQLSIAYLHHWSWLSMNISVVPKLTYKSSKLIDYYYGVDDRDVRDIALHYEASGGWQPSISISVSKPINKQWQWLFKSSIQKLHSGMSDSPLVEKSTVGSVFFGVGYRF